MNDLDLILALLGGLVMVLGLASARLARSAGPPTLLAFAAGVIVGPLGLGWLDLALLGDRATIVEKAARITLGIGLVGVALRVPREFPRRNWRDLLVLLGLGMPLMWLLTTTVTFALLDVGILTAALIAAVLTPTDPVAAGPIVTGPLAEEHIPQRLRDTISFESGANDGLAYLFLFLPLLLLTKPADAALAEWLTSTVLWHVLAATAIGFGTGWAAARLLQAAERRELIDGNWRLIYTVSLALVALGVGRLIRTDEVLLVFAAGAAFVQVVSADDRDEEERGQEAVNRFFAIPVFLLLGTVVPWDGWLALGWRGVAVAAGVLLLRRLPMLLLLRPLLRNVRDTREALFVGWFGPIAIAAAYYASLAERHLHDPRVWHVVSLVIAASVVAHGVTGAPLTRWVSGAARNPT